MTIDTNHHKSILIRILKDVFTNTSIGPFLGFKGGTAAMLFYNLNRFSVDLDFDLLEKNKETLVFEQIKEVLEKYGTLKKIQNKRYSLFFLLSYDKKLEGGYNIKVEINKRDFGSRFELKQYLGISIPVMIQSDMAANKMVAMLERIGQANRDIYDVWFFLHNHWPVNKKIIESRTELRYNQFLQKCIEHLEKITDRNILSGIGELLDEKQKAWAKSNLRKETIFLLKLALDNEK